MLDGGHLAFYAYEAVRRRPASMQVQEWAFRFGFVAIVLLMLVVTFNDLGSIGAWDGIALDWIGGVVQECAPTRGEAGLSLFGILRDEQRGFKDDQGADADVGAAFDGNDSGGARSARAGAA